MFSAKTVHLLGSNIRTIGERNSSSITLNLAEKSPNDSSARAALCGNPRAMKMSHQIIIITSVSRGKDLILIMNHHRPVFHSSPTPHFPQLIRAFCHSLNNDNGEDLEGDFSLHPLRIHWNSIESQSIQFSGVIKSNQGETCCYRGSAAAAAADDEGDCCRSSPRQQRRVLQSKLSPLSLPMTPL